MVSNKCNLFLFFVFEGSRPQALKMSSIIGVVDVLDLDLIHKLSTKNLLTSVVETQT